MAAMGSVVSTVSVVPGASFDRALRAFNTGRGHFSPLRSSSKGSVKGSFFLVCEDLIVTDI